MVPGTLSWTGNVIFDVMAVRWGGFLPVRCVAIV
jgi:hypothetical protein